MGALFFFTGLTSVVSDFILATLGEEWSSIYQLPIAILMLFFYLGGFYVFYEGVKKFRTKEKTEPQDKIDKQLLSGA